jgi:hypothetical protein
MNKRERVLKTLELSGEPDMCPINYLGFEHTCTAYQHFIKSDEYGKYVKIVPKVGDITQQRFFNVDCWAGGGHFGQIWSTPLISQPWKLLSKGITLSYMGKLHKISRNERTGLPYGWHAGSYFTSEEIVRNVWKKHGKPSKHIKHHQRYDRKGWDSYVKALEPYYYPLPSLPIAMHEAMFEGCGAAALAKFMRKSPGLFHEMMEEYTKVNLAGVKMLVESGVDVIFYFDDLGQRDRTILSLNAFREYILPYYRKIYDACHKGGALIVQHSCGFIDDFLPDMVDAGLNCIQALEPAAGVNMGQLKEKLGDRVAFMGGMDSTRTLCFGTPQDVYEDVKKCIKAAGKGGGYIAGPSHNIMDVPWENLMALRAAIEKYRKYPLQF